jgi:hypothetical protein
MSPSMAPDRMRKHMQRAGSGKGGDKGGCIKVQPSHNRPAAALLIPDCQPCEPVRGRTGEPPPVELEGGRKVLDLSFALLLSTGRSHKSSQSCRPWFLRIHGLSLIATFPMALDRGTVVSTLCGVGQRGQIRSSAVSRQHERWMACMHA